MWIWQNVDVAECGCGRMWMWQNVDVAKCGCGRMWMWQNVDVAECGRGHSWPNLSYYPGIFLGRLRKIMKIFSKRLGFTN